MHYHTTQSQDLLIMLDTICVCLQLVDDPIFIPIEQLEQKGGKPAEFSEVVREMKAGKTGHLRIKKARKGLGKVRSVVVVELGNYLSSSLSLIRFRTLQC